MSSLSGILAAAVLMASTAPAYGQGWTGGLGSRSPEEVPYVNLETILAGFEAFRGKVVRTSGRLDLHPGGRFRLRDDDGNALDIVPDGSILEKFKLQGRTSLGRNCEVTGWLGQGSTFEGSPAGADTLLTLYFRSYTIANQWQSGERPSPPPPVPVASPATPASPPRPKAPPVVVFALPLEGDADVAADERFTVQFSKDMDRASFEGRVILRYAGPVQPGDPSLAKARVTYNEGQRALTVDPGVVLPPGRSIELLLLPGITDTEGLPLMARQETAGNDAVEVLRYQVRTDIEERPSRGDRRHARSNVAPPHPRTEQ